METILNQFLEMTCNGCQVINLGAGFDTRYWQLKESGTSPMMFYDVDFGAVTSRKCMAVRWKRIDNDDSKRDVKLKLSWFLTLRQKKALQLYFDASVEYGLFYLKMIFFNQKSFIILLLQKKTMQFFSPLAKHFASL